MNEEDKKLPELDIPTQHLMAMAGEIGTLKAEKAHFFWRNDQLENDNKELKKNVEGLESRNRMLESQRDELREEQVKWLKKK